MNFSINPLSANPTKWSNPLKQFVGNLPTNCLSVFDHFARLVLRGLRILSVNVTKYAAEEIPNGKLHFVCSAKYGSLL